jgi:CHAT domain-containing protein
LFQGEFSRAREHLGRSLQDNTISKTDVHFLQLKRDAELAAGMAAVLETYLPRLVSVYRYQETRFAETRQTGEGSIYFREALRTNEELRLSKVGPFLPEGDHEKIQANVHAFLGLIEGMRGNAPESLQELVIAAETSRSRNYREAEIRSLIFLGELGLSEMNRNEGRLAAETLKERADQYQASSYRVWARLLLSRYARERGARNEAIAYLQEAEAILSSQRSEPEAEMFGEICRLQRRAVYEFLVELLASAGRAGEALTVAEKAKSLSMIHLLSGQDIGATAVQRQWFQRGAEMSGSIRRLQRRILHLSGDEGHTGEFVESLRGIRTIEVALLREMEAKGKDFLSLIAPRSIEPTALQRLLDEDTTLFSYFATDTGLYVWAIHRNLVQLVKIDLTRAELRGLVFAYLEAIYSRDRRKTDSLSRRVYDQLLKPAIPFVTGDRIGFIPDDCLHYLPFAAMNYRGRYLTEGFSIFYLPSASWLEHSAEQKPRPGRRILAFGDPDLQDETLDLHHAAEELKRIRKQGDMVLLREQASEMRAAGTMPNFDVIHFAVRGLLNAADPLSSGLLLTPGGGRDGILTALEIFRLQYQGQTVVLSGCETAPDKDPEAKSFTVLQQAFLHAGSYSVVPSLWLVGDQASSYLLEIFYRQFERNKTASDALRTAQLRLIREGYPPHVWAAFIVTGKF